MYRGDCSILSQVLLIERGAELAQNWLRCAMTHLVQVVVLTEVLLLCSADRVGQQQEVHACAAAMAARGSPH